MKALGIAVALAGVAGLVWWLRDDGGDALVDPSSTSALPLEHRPHPGPVFSPFGPRGGRLHAGVDIAGDDGDAVVSVWAGTVQHVQTPEQWARREPGPGRDAGAYIEVTHALDELPPSTRDALLELAPDAEGVVTRYMHLGTTDVRPGAVVAAGEQLATLGRTGVERSRTHLHFETRVAEPPARYGDPLDPAALGVV